MRENNVLKLRLRFEVKYYHRKLEELYNITEIKLMTVWEVVITSHIQITYNFYFLRLLISNKCPF